MRYILLVILVALAVLLVLRFGKSQKTNPVKEADALLDNAKLAVLPMQLQQVEAALDAYAAERGSHPGDLAELVPGYLRGADLLIDPWGTPLRLDEGEEEKAFLVSAGPDRAFATGDDIRRSL